MANTDSAYFIPLYNYIIQSNIYIPSIPNQEEGWYYCNFMASNQVNSELEQSYKKFIQGYTTKNQTLKLDWDWIYYYVYVILYCDYGNSINSKLYDKITEQIINGEFVVQDKINAVKQIMISCGKTPDIINGWMEGSIISLMEEIIELDLEEEFNKIVSEIRYSTLKSFRDIIPYMIEKMQVEKMDNVKCQDKYKKYFDILQGKN